MNFFRSEEHLRKWEGFKGEGGIISLESLMQVFSGSFMKNRMGGDWVSRSSEYLTEMMETLDKLQGAGKYWRLAPYEKLGFPLALKLGLL
jgi:hypothetical protein